MSNPVRSLFTLLPASAQLGIKRVLRILLRRDPNRSIRSAFWRIVRDKKYVYEPISIGGTFIDGDREWNKRWSAIAVEIELNSVGSVLDIGCAEGWFLRQAAERYGCFALGVDMDDKAIAASELARIHDRTQRHASMLSTMTTQDISALPQFDLVLCLSVAHHVIRTQGLAAARDFVTAVASRARKVLIFEMGTASEVSFDWSQQMPEMPQGQEAFIRDFLHSCGLNTVRVIAQTPGLHREAGRLLVAATH
jgi:SAM-dependent methyltransferase